MQQRYDSKMPYTMRIRYINKVDENWKMIWYGNIGVPGTYILLFVPLEGPEKSPF